MSKIIYLIKTVFNKLNLNKAITFILLLIYIKFNFYLKLQQFLIKYYKITIKLPKFLNNYNNNLLLSKLAT